MKINIFRIMLINFLIFFSGCLTNQPGPVNINKRSISPSISPEKAVQPEIETVFPVPPEKNMARLPGVIINVSSTYSEDWNKERLTDGDFKTSWFTNIGDAANLGTTPFIELVFPQPIIVSEVNLRGNREFANEYDILEGELTITGKTGIAEKQSVIFPGPKRDIDIKLKNELRDIISVRFTFTKDISTEPGLSEIEIVGRI